jgi:hypothetical protein
MSKIKKPSFHLFESWAFLRLYAAKAFQSGSKIELSTQPNRLFRFFKKRIFHKFHSLQISSQFYQNFFIALTLYLLRLRDMRVLV